MDSSSSSSSSSSSHSYTSLTARRCARNAALDTKLRQMALPLAPLVQLTTGAVHPAFPATLLAFWLLTDAQLDSLAHFYHQRTPCRWTAHYPCPVSWPPGLGLEDKRRKMGRFIGLRGCETPAPAPAPAVKSEDDILDEARRARLAAEEDDAGEVALRRKLGWYS